MISLGANVNQNVGPPALHTNHDATQAAAQLAVESVAQSHLSNFVGADGLNYPILSWNWAVVGYENSLVFKKDFIYLENGQISEVFVPVYQLKPIMQAVPVYGAPILPAPTEPQEILKPTPAAAVQPQIEEASSPEDKENIAPRELVQREPVFLPVSEMEGEKFRKLLGAYVIKVNKGEKREYLTNKGRKLLSEGDENSTPKEWETTALHVPPVALLNSLNKIQSFFLHYNKPDEGVTFHTFLFPCKIELDGKKSTPKLAKSKNHMVLELSLNSKASPTHLFIRPFDFKNEAYCDKHLGHLKGEVESVLRVLNAPDAHKNSNILAYKSTCFGMTIKMLRKNA